eukprot:302862_1
MAERQPLTTAEKETQKTTALNVTGEGVSAFESNKFDMEEMKVLGIEEDDPYYRIDFNDSKTVSYLTCFSFLISLSTFVLWPLWLMFSCCIYWGIKKRVSSRRAALTNTHLIFHEGSFGLGCIFWNEATKSVPLEKITDLSVKQGCVNACFDIKDITVDTASVTQEANELHLIGIKQPEGLRKKVLRIRDRNSAYMYGAQIPLKIQRDNESNPLIDGNNNKDITQMNQTLFEIKDLLIEMNQNMANLKNDKE